MYNVIDVLSSHRDSDEILRHAAVRLLLVAKLLVRRQPGVDSQGFGVANAIKGQSQDT